MQTLLFALLALLQAADVGTTYYVLYKGGCELNPLLSGLMNRFGNLPVLVLEKCLMLAGIWFALPTMGPVKFQVGMLAFCVVIYLGVVGHNLTQIRR